MAVYADISKCLLLQYTYREWLYEKKCDQWDCFSDVLRRFRMLTERGIEGQGLSRAHLRAKSANVQRISSFQNVLHVIYLEKNNNGGVSVSGEKTYFYL